MLYSIIGLSFTGAVGTPAVCVLDKLPFAGIVITANVVNSVCSGVNRFAFEMPVDVANVRDCGIGYVSVVVIIVPN